MFFPLTSGSFSTEYNEGPRFLLDGRKLSVESSLVCSVILQ